MKFLTPFLILILILGIIGIYGCIRSYTTNQSSNYANAQVSSNIRWVTLN